MKLFLALPVYGGYDPHFTACLMNLITHRPCEMIVRPHVGDSLVARARNRLAAQFLRSDATHLLFLDTDLIFSVDQVARLIAHDVPLVAGLYPKKQKELGWVCNTLDEPQETRENGLLPMKYAGTGCLLVAREVFYRMIENLPGIEYDPDDGDAPGVAWDFFATGVWKCPNSGRRRYLSEDWFFCQRARDLGIEVLVDTQVVLKHVGQAVYPLQELEEYGEPLTREAE